jgi:hypothetical protein
MAFLSRQSAPTAAEGFSPGTTIDEIDDSANNGKREQQLGDEQNWRNDDLPDQDCGYDHSDDLEQIPI